MEKRHYKGISDEEKVRALKRHLLERVAVSVVCDELGIAPSLFYTWQHRLFAHGVSAFERKVSSQAGASAERRRSELLQEHLRQREEALAELLTELLTLKKDAWTSLTRANWAEPDHRDAVVAFVHSWRARTGLPLRAFIKPLQLRRERFHEWERRYGKEHENKRRHSAIGYVTPKDKLFSEHTKIFADRDAKIARTREIRRARRTEGN